MVSPPPSDLQLAVDDNQQEAPVDFNGDQQLEAADGHQNALAHHPPAAQSWKQVVGAESSTTELPLAVPESVPAATEPADCLSVVAIAEPAKRASLKRRSEDNPVLPSFAGPTRNSMQREDTVDETDQQLPIFDADVRITSWFLFLNFTTTQDQSKPH